MQSRSRSRAATGRKVFALQTLPECDAALDDGVGKVAGVVGGSRHESPEPQWPPFKAVSRFLNAAAHRAVGSQALLPRIKEIPLHLQLMSIEVDQIAASLHSEGALSAQPREAPAGTTDLGGYDVDSSLNHSRTGREHYGRCGPAPGPAGQPDSAGGGEGTARCKGGRWRSASPVTADLA